MTRWARGTDSNRRQPKESTPWSQLKTPTETGKAESTSGKKTNPLVINIGKESDITPVETGQQDEKSKGDLNTSHQSKQKQKKNLAKKSKNSDVSKSEKKQKKHKRISESVGLTDEKAELMVARLAYKQPAVPRTEGLASQLLKLQHEAVSSADQQEISTLLRKEDRREKRRLERMDDRDSKKICFHCRGSGHDLSSCPSLGPDASQTMSVCFKCGSTEHTMNQCKLRLPSGVLPYSKCFICGELGHLSKQCPDNPRGLYPNGGCCRTCGSVEHYKKDCPKLQVEQGLVPVRLEKLNSRTSADADIEIFHSEEHTTCHEPKKKRPKIVKF